MSLLFHLLVLSFPGLVALQSKESERHTPTHIVARSCVFGDRRRRHTQACRTSCLPPTTGLKALVLIHFRGFSRYFFLLHFLHSPTCPTPPCRTFMQHAVHTQYASQDKQLRSLTQKASAIGDIKMSFVSFFFFFFLNVAVAGRNKRVCTQWG